MMAPVSSTLRDLSSQFPQVAIHNSSLQVAVGSTRPLGGAYRGGAGTSGTSPAAVGGVSVVQAPTVAVFDMNGGAKKKVLLLPVLLDDLEQEQQQGGGGAASQPVQSPRDSSGYRSRGVGGGGAAGRHVGPFGSTNSLQSNTSSVSNADSGSGPGLAAAAAAHSSLMAENHRGLVPLWSTAEGVPGGGSAAAAAQGRSSGSMWGGVLGGSSSSSLSTSTAAYDTPGGSRSSSCARLGELPRGGLASNTMTRAEAAMVEGWFGGGSSAGSPGEGSLAAAAAAAPSAAAAAALQSPPDARVSGSSDGAPGGGSAWGGGGSGDREGVGVDASSSAALQCGVLYPDPATASSPVLCASEVSGGVAAVACSPGGDAVAAFVLPCHCVVVWRLGSSWTQRLAHLGSSKPMSQMPHAYIRLPAAGLLVDAVFKYSTAADTAHQHHHHHQQQSHRHHHHHHGHHREGEGGGGEVLQWQVKWATDSHIDLLYQGCLCGSVEVQL